MSRKNRMKDINIPPLAGVKPQAITMTGNQGLFFHPMELPGISTLCYMRCRSTSPANMPH